MEGYLHQPLRSDEWGFLILLAAIAGGVLIGIVAMLANSYRKLRADELDATLKMEMIQRGMSGSEIRQVIESRTTSSTRALSDVVHAAAPLQVPPTFAA